MHELTHTPQITAGDVASKRIEIKAHFLSGFERFESLHQLLADEQAYYQQPEPLRHPIIFYLGHTAVFFANKLKVSKIIDHSIDDRIEAMMAIGVDEMSWDDLNQVNYQWPEVHEVYEYRQKVKALVLNLLDELPMTLPIQWDDPFWIILMGIEHERIHLETSSVLIRQLDVKYIKASKNWTTHIETVSPIEATKKNHLIHIPASEVRQSKDESTYGWDNEYGELVSSVAAFKASQFLVSQAEYLQFVDDGGYQDVQWWCEEGAAWLAYTKAQHPTFWRKENNQWQYRSLVQWQDMPWSLPVDVNYLEAKAFCHWLSARSSHTIRLPSEAEWYALVQHVGIPFQASPSSETANLHMAHGASASAVDRFCFGTEGFGDVIGNVWQWTETAINALPGFKVHPAYDDFSVPTFDGRHNLIKGGSWASSGNEALPEARYAFRRHFFQHAGFRYVESEQPITQHFNTYETDELISQYLEFHYGDEYFGIPNFPKTCIETIIKHAEGYQFDRVLDLGCAVGRSSFELARHANHVDAVDFSTRFIRNAINLIKHEEVKYLTIEEGELTNAKQFQLATLALGDKVKNIDFSQGDACNLKDKYCDYDLVFAGNLIDRLYQPAAFIKDIKKRINAGGYLALTSPYTWLEEFTNKENWLGGYKNNGENVRTLDHLKTLLAPEFEPVHHQDIPFVIRETARKHQHTLAQFSLWKKTSKTQP